MKKPLELMPIEQFKKFVAAIAKVPKEVVERDSSKPKREPKKKAG